MYRWIVPVNNHADLGSQVYANKWSLLTNDQVSEVGKFRALSFEDSLDYLLDNELIYPAQYKEYYNFSQLVEE